MRKLVSIALVALFFYGCGSAKSLVTADKTPIIVTMDLVNVIDDKVKVEVDPGAFKNEIISFYIPKTIPGTYSADDYGQYIEGFKALDYDGNELTTAKGDVNTWIISNGKELDKVIYKVNDTYDSEREVKEAVFSPAGTNILKGENYVLNLHGFVGYFDGLQEVPYKLAIKRPIGLESTTSLRKKAQSDDPKMEIFLADRYFGIVDNPILYTKPNTESFQINDITVTLSVYSPNGVYTASGLKDRMEEMMKAQKTFLGEIDGTKEYNILLYLSKLDEEDAMGFGALEHHTSTVVVLPESIPKEALEQTMVDVVSHEFFHIVTPLNIHSKEVQFFDYNDPKMSQHLWMYEGTTEYFANLFQIQQGLIDEAEFYNRIVEKISNAKAYDDMMSFTVMSQNILEEPYKKNYANVYEKGALINMALDITLRDLSNGEKGVRWLMKELSKKYGNNTPFEDDRLIDEIVVMTYPEVRTFFEKHVVGGTPIAYDVFLSKVGLAKVTSEMQSGYFFNGEVPYIDVDPSDGQSIFIRNGIDLHSSMKELGLKGGDIIKNINGTSISLESIRPLIMQSFGWTPEVGLKMVVERDDKEITLEGKVDTPMINVETIKPLKDATEAQIALRKAWLKG